MKTIQKRALLTLTIAFLACAFLMMGKTKAFAFSKSDINDTDSLAKVTGVTIDATTSSSSVIVKWNQHADNSVGYFITLNYYDSSENLLGSSSTYFSNYASTSTTFSKTYYSGATRYSACIRAYKYTDTVYISSKPAYASYNHAWAEKSSVSIPKLEKDTSPSVYFDYVNVDLNYPTFEPVEGSSSTRYETIYILKDNTCNQILSIGSTTWSSLSCEYANIENHSYTLYTYNAVWCDEYSIWLKSPAVSYKIILTKPDTKFKQSVSCTASSQTVKWTTPATKCDGFKIYRASEDSYEFTLIATVGSSTRSYTDKSKIGYYEVFAYFVMPYTKARGLSSTKYMPAYVLSSSSVYTPSSSDSDMSSFYKDCIIYKIPAPTLKSVSQSAAGRTITWSKSGMVDGYVVYCKKKGDSKYTKIATITSSSTSSFTDKRKIAKDTELTYLVKAYEEMGSDLSYYSSSSNVKTVKAKVYTPTAATISSITNVSTGVKLKWTTSKNCAGYYVYRKQGSGSYKKLATITSPKTLTYTDKTAVNGTVYTYMITAYSFSSTKASTAKTFVRLGMENAISASSTVKHQANVSWSASTGADGYEICIVSGDYSTTKIIAGSSTLSATINNLMSTEAYTIKVRSYKTVSGKKYYSCWSKSLMVTAL